VPFENGIAPPIVPAYGEAVPGRGPIRPEDPGDLLAPTDGERSARSTLALERAGAMRVGVARRGTVTVTKPLFGGLPEGATLDLTLRHDGVFELRPTGAEDGSQDLFRSPRRRAMGRQADEAIAAARYGRFAHVEEFLSDLDARKCPARSWPTTGR
jgi:hypothetical protein